MTFEVQRIRGVNNHYGTRDTRSGAGSYTTNNNERTHTIVLDETSYGGFLPEITIYAGERITGGTVTGVDQAAGTGQTLDITLRRLDNDAETDYAITDVQAEVAPGVTAAITSMANVTANVAADSLLVLTGLSAAGTRTTVGKVIVQIKTERIV